MNLKWQELVGVLQKILSIYKAILMLSQEKKQILVTAKSHDLEKVIKQEEILILQLGKLEEVRRKIVAELVAAHGITDEKVTLTHLQEIVAPDVALELKKFGDEIEAIMAEIVPLNKINTELINQALGFINYNINILSQTVVGPTYAAKGHANEQAKRTVFDAKV